MTKKLTGLLVLLSVITLYSQAQIITPIKDLIEGPGGSMPKNLVNLNGIVLFSATNEEGEELWRSDGTEAGTYMVKDINPGSASSHPGGFHLFNNKVYFTAKDIDNGFNLWISDGTKNGTKLFKKTAISSGYTYPHKYYEFNGELYFYIAFPENQAAIWKTDGTEQGTVVVQNLFDGVKTYYVSEIYSYNNYLYYLTHDLVDGFKLWKCDGTSNPAELIKNIGQYSPSQYAYKGNDFLEYDSKMFFWVDDGIHGTELWKSDGTEAGTVLVKDIVPGQKKSVLEEFIFPIVANQKLFFWAESTISHNSTLWMSDGTEEGTIEVNLELSVVDQHPKAMVSFNDKTYFFSRGIDVKDKLWVTDGSNEGTYNINKDLVAPNDLLLFNEKLYFTTMNGLWVSDGTEEGTQIISSIKPAERIPNLTPVGELIFYAANHPVDGIELWKTDGTVGSAHMIKKIYNGENYLFFSYPSIEYNNQLYYLADDKEYDYDLWKTDGTPEGNERVSPGFTSYHNVTYFTRLNKLFLAGSAGLWVSDGTEEGSMFLNNLFTRSSRVPESRYKEFSNIENEFVYWHEDFSDNLELWKSDGTIDGTHKIIGLKKENSGDYNSSKELNNTNNTLFFRGNDGILGGELYKTDGTEAGTGRIKDINPGPKGSSLENFNTINDLIYFSADNGSQGKELWRSNGTESGTYLVKDIQTGVISSNPNNLVNIGNILIFTAFSEQYGRELWQSDGTEEGTSIIKDIYPGTLSSNPENLNVHEGIVYFSARTDKGLELWRTDGTEKGTYLLKDIYPGSTSSNPQYFYSMHQILYFNATDPVYGTELWRTDGTEGGTFIIADKNPNGSSNPQHLVAYNGSLYFNADNGASGLTLFRFEKPELAISLEDDSFCKGKPVKVKLMTQNMNVKPTNTFSLQLSDKNGNFNNLQTLATLQADDANEIEGIIPSSIETGSKYRVRVTSSDFYYISENNGTDLTIEALPEADIVTDGLVLTAIAADSYEWFLNDQPLGKTSQFITATESGSYSVEVKKGKCKARSKNIELHVLNVEENSDSGVNFFPNPAHDKLYLTFDTDWRGAEVQILDIMGRIENSIVVKEDQSELVLSLDNKPAGLYLIKIVKKDKKLVKRIEKI